MQCKVWWVAEWLLKPFPDWIDRHDWPTYEGWSGLEWWLLWSFLWQWVGWQSQSQSQYWWWQPRWPFHRDSSVTTLPHNDHQHQRRSQMIFIAFSVAFNPLANIYQHDSHERDAILSDCLRNSLWKLAKSTHRALHGPRTGSQCVPDLQGFPRQGYASSWWIFLGTKND